MTCIRNSVVLALTGITFLGLVGCETGAYKPWQSGEAEENMQAEAEAAHTTPATSAAPVMASDSGNTPATGMSATSRTTGDVLLIDSMQNTPAIQTPRNGVGMASVRQQYGNPISEGSAVGDPPITRWEYEGFSVYFEHDLVLHSVVHRPNQN